MSPKRSKPLNKNKLRKRNRKSLKMRSPMMRIMRVLLMRNKSRLIRLQHQLKEKSWLNLIQSQNLSPKDLKMALSILKKLRKLHNP